MTTDFLFWSNSLLNKDHRSLPAPSILATRNYLFFLMSDLCGNCLKKNKKLPPSQLSTWNMGLTNTYLHACSYFVLHIDKANSLVTHGLTHKQNSHIDHASQKPHSKQEIVNAFSAGMSDRRLETWEDLGWAEARNICRSKRAREGKKRETLCVQMMQQQCNGESRTRAELTPSRRRKNPAFLFLRQGHPIVFRKKSCPETQV